MVRLSDPDVLCAYEIQKASLGYLVERYACAGFGNLCTELSRLKPYPGGGAQGSVACLGDVEE